MKIGTDKNRKWFALIPTIVFSPIIYVSIIIIWILSVSYYPKKDFNKEKWDTNIEQRYEMSKDIIKSEMLIGKTKEEVIEILGQDYYEGGKDIIYYYLGFVPALFNIDPDILDIYFENGKVIKVSQHTS